MIEDLKDKWPDCLELAILFHSTFTAWMICDFLMDFDRRSPLRPNAVHWIRNRAKMGAVANRDTRLGPLHLTLVASGFHYTHTRLSTVAVYLWLVEVSSTHYSTVFDLTGGRIHQLDCRLKSIALAKSVVLNKRQRRCRVTSEAKKVLRLRLRLSHSFPGVKHLEFAPFCPYFLTSIN